jgi:hypothetical protein
MTTTRRWQWLHGNGGVAGHRWWWSSSAERHFLKCVTNSRRCLPFSSVLFCLPADAVVDGSEAEGEEAEGKHETRRKQGSGSKKRKRFRNFLRSATAVTLTTDILCCFSGVGQTAHAESLTYACRVGMLCSRHVGLRAWKGWKGAVCGRKVKSSYISIGHGLSTIPSTSLMNTSLTSSVEEYYS